MQIYYTDRNPAKCAANLPDQLTYSTLKEIVQIWSKFLHQKGLSAPYKQIAQGRHYVDWMNESGANIYWMKQYCQALQHQYNRAFGNGKLLASYKDFIQCFNMTPVPGLKTERDHTTPPSVFVKDFQPYELNTCWDSMNVVERNRFYLNWKVNQFQKDGKSFRLYAWTNREKPKFITF